MAFRKRHLVGAAPGTLSLPADGVPPRMTAFRYTADSIEETELTSADDLTAAMPNDDFVWLDVQGLGDEKILKTLATRLGVHPLALEDAVNVPQRPKSDQYPEHHLIVARMARYTDTDELDVEQVTLVVGERYVLTLQERYGDILEPVRKRLREASGRIRTAGPDYLAYAIVDTIVDGYYPLLEVIGDELEALEELVMVDPTPEALRRINKLRVSLARLRRAVWPHRELLHALVRGEHKFIREDTQLYLRDVYDHSVQLAEVLDSNREMASGLLNTYLSVIGHRTNEVMKVLTIMATIFIPLTFLAGIYGMNFEYMPELRFRWAYPLLWVVMIATFFILLGYFRRRGWIGRPSDRE